MPPLHDSHTRLMKSLEFPALPKSDAFDCSALLRVKSATAMEIHKSSGIPRALVYPIAGQLPVRDPVTVSTIRA